MSIARQVVYPESALCRFLDARLPQRRLIVDDWARQTDKAPWSAITADVDHRSGLGLAAEYRIGLDLAKAPGYWDPLSFLSPMECNILPCATCSSPACRPARHHRPRTLPALCATPGTANRSIAPAPPNGPRMSVNHRPPGPLARSHGSSLLGMV